MKKYEIYLKSVRRLLEAVDSIKEKKRLFELAMLNYRKLYA